MPNTTTKQERAKRVEFAKALLLKRGFTPEQSGAGLIVDELVRKFGYADRRQARVLEAKAARLLRGDAVEGMTEPGRPRTIEVLRHGDVVELLRCAGGGMVGSEAYLVVINGGQTWLTSEESDDYLLRKIRHDTDQ